MIPSTWGSGPTGPSPRALIFAVRHSLPASNAQNVRPRVRPLFVAKKAVRSGLQDMARGDVKYRGRSAEGTVGSYHSAKAKNGRAQKQMATGTPTYLDQKAVKLSPS